MSFSVGNILRVGAFVLPCTIATAQVDGEGAAQELSLNAGIADQADSKPKVLSRGAIWENDGAFIKPYDSSDRHYTNGVMIDFAFDHLLPQEWIDLLPWEGQFENMSQATGVVIGQQIFTSKDIERRQRQPGDRPYAGWLYAGLYYQRADIKKLDHFELNIGAVGGDWSMAESTQKFIHSIVPGEHTPQGWDDQFSNEVGVVFKYQRRWRFRYDRENSERPLVDFDFIPEAGFMLGNVYTNANTAMTLRIGANLPDDFGPTRMAQFRDVTGSTRGDYSAYAFGRLGGTLVGRNTFLDGNTFATSVSVGKEEAFGEAAAGIGLRFKKFEYSWSFTWRTLEFKDQDHGDAFGAMTLSWRTTF